MNPLNKFPAAVTAAALALSACGGGGDDDALDRCFDAISAEAARIESTRPGRDDPGIVWFLAERHVLDRSDVCDGIAGEAPPGE